MNRAIAALHGHFGRACLYAQNRSMATHAHREGHLIFHLDGQIPTMRVSAREHLLVPGRALAINPFEPHDIVYRDDEPECLLLLLYIDPSWFLEVGAEAAGPLRFGLPTIELCAETRRLIERVVALLVDGSAAPAPRFDAALYVLIRDCYERSWSRGACALAQGGARESGPRDHRVQKSVRLLQRGVGGEISFDHVAREVGLSRPHFFKLFREHVGVTPNVYVNTFRSERAIERLIGTEQAVTSIGLDLGFASQASFTRFFSANVGIPPSDYRRVAHVA